MKPLATVSVLTSLLAMASPLTAQAPRPELGRPAPEFTLPDTRGMDHTLSEYRGKYVVLEWLNYGCPTVQKHYDAGNMQALQEEWTGKGVIWFSVVSSAPGKQGYYEPEEMNAQNEAHGNQASAVLLDPSGEMGHLYRALVTPHMMVIDPDGILIYNGAIDDRPGTQPSTLEGAHNYVAAALTESMAGQEVSVPLSQPYGCGVKY